MKRYGVPITLLFLLTLATGLYGESDDQPKWNTTLFGALFFDGTTEKGIGGAVSYRFLPRLELEGEVYTLFWRRTLYGVSGGLLYNFNIILNKVCPYVLGGLSQIRGEGVSTYIMFGGGVKIDLAKSLKMRFDLRFQRYEGGIWTKLSTGLMWTFG
ncbi:MAG: hypothetical protein OEX80_07305 [Candidatus Aminicenantes bacterium]|nr:hypothetical protein [Candidatus Aminicenantes bacterium]